MSKSLKPSKPSPDVPKENQDADPGPFQPTFSQARPEVVEQLVDLGHALEERVALKDKDLH